jgi:NTE family protein
VKPVEGRPQFLEGLSDVELADVLGELELRRFPAESVVIAEGDALAEMYVIRDGTADVFVSDRQGVEHLVGRSAPGSTLGEMSLFTGQPAAGTVRATSDLDVLVMSQSDFDRAAARFPQLYRNVGAILSDRLAQTNRLTLQEAPGLLVALADDGAPPELGCALACSVAWHTRSPVLLVAVVEEAVDAFEQLATLQQDEVFARPRGKARAHVIGVAPSGRFGADALAGTVAELLRSWDYVFVQASDSVVATLEAARVVHLAQAPAQRPDPGEYVIEGWTASPGKRPDLERVVRVPSLERADEEALAGGLLPPGSAAGDALGWMARELTGLSVGVALGGGGLRGYAHIGVLEKLGSAGVPVDYVAGTSVGGGVAALYALGYDAETSADGIDEMAKVVFRPTIPWKSFLSHRGVRKFMRTHLGDTLIEDLDVPIALVAADVISRREIVFRRGLLRVAVMATGAVPGILPAMPIGPYTAVDGGVLDPVPGAVTAQMGAGVVLAVKLGSEASPPEPDAEAVEVAGKVPSAVSVLLRSIEIMQSRIAPDPPAVPTITITPEFGPLPSGSTFRRFALGRPYVAAGAEAAEAALPRLAAVLPWLRG